VTVEPNALERYRLKLSYKVRYHLGSSCPDVNDVVQETLFRFLRAGREQRIRNPESTGAFLSGICNNVIQEYRRRQWREPLGDPDSAPPPSAKDPEPEMLELRQAIALAMSHLSQRDRSILSAFFLEEKCREEICCTMGFSDAQFRVALFRAKGRFRKSYHETMKQEAPGKH
jgi:RNA polymerase sigma-70 factor (ECF subfamily)